MSDVVEKEEERRLHERHEQLMGGLAGSAMILMIVLVLLGVNGLVVSLILGLVNLVSYLLFAESLVVILLSSGYLVSWFKVRRKVVRGWN